MTKLSTDFILASPSRYNWSCVDDLDKLIVYPDPSDDDLYHANYSPDHLDANGLVVPEDEDEAYRFALASFKGTAGHDEWKQQFDPQMTVFWPCAPTVDPRAAANAMYAAGLSCVLISGQVDDITMISGFALTSGGADLSDHLAAAYICSGQTPPVVVTQRALALDRPKVMEPELKEAAESISQYLNSTITRLNETLEDSRGLRP